MINLMNLCMSNMMDHMVDNYIDNCNNLYYTIFNKYLEQQYNKDIN
jgi:hypothetical protein